MERAILGSSYEPLPSVNRVKPAAISTVQPKAITPVFTQKSTTSTPCPTKAITLDRVKSKITDFGNDILGGLNMPTLKTDNEVKFDTKTIALGAIVILVLITISKQLSKKSR